MFRVKRARSLIHSISHHGVSPLSFLHPKLGQETKSQNKVYVEFDLLEGNIISENFEASNETLRAVKLLKSTFEDIAKKEGILVKDISDANITFGFEKGRWPSYCICEIFSNCGKEIKVKVNTFGRKYGPLSEFI